jgi:fructokinase
LDPAGVAKYSFYINGTADWAWQKSELPNLEKLLSIKVKAVQFGCLAMAIEPGNLVIETWLHELADSQAITLSHDLNIRPSLGLDRTNELQRIRRINARSHIIKASDADLEWLYDLPPGGELDEICFNWSAGSKLVVVTKGALGACIYSDGKRLDVGAPKVQLVDTIGAGDTFMANFLAELSAIDGLGDSPKNRLAGISEPALKAAASIAVMAAAIVCERAGCEPPTSQEVMMRMNY